MNGGGEHNGQPNGQIWVRFDADKPDKRIDLATAETMLQRWRARNAAQFGFWLAEAITGTEPSKTARTGSQ
jgi:hypothetical protein